MIGFRTRCVARVTTAGGVDDWGSPMPGETVETPFYGELQPLSSVEKVQAGLDRSIDLFRLFLPASVKLDSNAAVVVDGVTYQVQGTPEPHRLAGRVHHYEALAKVVSTPSNVESPATDPAPDPDGW